MRDQIARCLISPTDVERAAVRINGDHALNARPRANGPFKPAAVLVPIVLHDSGPSVLLTQRTDHLNAHAGQVSFPGGRTEPDDRHPIDTALRETHEEIGLAPQHVDVAGLLENYQTGTGYMVTPVVGFVRPGFVLTLDRFEVADAFEVPLHYVLDPVNHHIEQRAWNGGERRYYALRYDGRFIWGATAGMLVSLYRRLRDTTNDVATNDVAASDVTTTGTGARLD